MNVSHTLLRVQDSKISDVLAIFRVGHSHPGKHGENVDGGKDQHKVVFCKNTVQYQQGKYHALQLHRRWDILSKCCEIKSSNAHCIVVVVCDLLIPLLDALQRGYYACE